jgi:hypothetical protein
MNYRHFKGTASLLIGMALIYFGDRMLGVKIELFSGLYTFNLAWALDIFFVPFLVGMVVAWIYGSEAHHSGKAFRFSQGISMIIWVCYFPPLIVRSISYAEILYGTGAPEGSSLMPFGLWACFVVMTMTTAGMGEIVGEVMIKAYGRTSRTASTVKSSRSSSKESKL